MSGVATRQVTLRHKVVINLNANEREKYGLGPNDPLTISLPAGLVNVPEGLCDHWMVKAAIEEGKRPLMAGPRIEHMPITPEQTTAPVKAEDTILSDTELEKMDDDQLREYLRTAGNQMVAADVPRDKVLGRIAKLRPKAN